MRLDEWLRDAESRLALNGMESPRLEAQVLAAHVLGVDRSTLLAHPGLEVSELAGEHLLQRRLGHEPLAYITGWRDFYGRRFSVRPGVLIPRHETETLVEAALEMAGVSERFGLLDLGTGSGCLAATLKLERPAWTIMASDISTEALEIARENCHHLRADVQLVNCDACSAFATQAFDLIVTNPPYVGIAENLPVEIKNWEPHNALYAEHSGLAFYRLLSWEAGDILKTDGKLTMEVGAGQDVEVREIFESAGWIYTNAWKDLSGIPRVIGFSKPK